VLLGTSQQTYFAFGDNGHAELALPVDSDEVHLVSFGGIPGPS
jgi:hypothetical protein